ncbi:glucokinase [Legionella sp. WA2024007413]
MSDGLKDYAIVADIGGTFARFSRVNLNNLLMDKIEIYSCAAYPSFESLFSAYKSQHGLDEIKQAALAIACPVLGDVICMTNAHWRFSINEVKQKLGLTVLKVLNDFNAIAMSLPVLTTQQILQIGRGTAEQNGTRAILGAGTGLGVAFLVSTQEGYSAHAGEGGHISWGAKTEQEWFIYRYLRRKYEHVSYERLLSGQGLENLYEALASLHQREIGLVSASEIIALALAQQCTIAEATVAQFFEILGSFAGDLALIFAAFGGVYIAGGIVPRLITLLHGSDFRSCFEEKGRFSDFNAKIPTYVITAEQPGILGAAVYLKQSWLR